MPSLAQSKELLASDLLSQINIVQAKIESTSKPVFSRHLNSYKRHLMRRLEKIVAG